MKNDCSSYSKNLPCEGKNKNEATVREKEVTEDLD
jgi:hypothetical protein